MLVVDLDDFGCDHIISDQCQSHDCRDVLLKLKEINPKFKITLFAIPGEMTPELVEWCYINRLWIELAQHGFFHTSNYECEKMTYGEFDTLVGSLHPTMIEGFVKGFKAPGWQISDDIYKWLLDHGWWVADQSYNDDRRPRELSAYVKRDNGFQVRKRVKRDDFETDVKIIGHTGYNLVGEMVDSWHGHTWNCVGNGIYERFDELQDIVKNETEFKFISEVLV
jgi:hypothetical protein